MLIPQSPHLGQDRQRKKAICRHKRCCEREVIPKRDRFPWTKVNHCRRKPVRRQDMTAGSNSPIVSQKTCITPVPQGAGWYVQRAIFLLFMALYGRNRKYPLISSYLKSAYFYFRKYAGSDLRSAFVCGGVSRHGRLPPKVIFGLCRQYKAAAYQTPLYGKKGEFG